MDNKVIWYIIVNPHAGSGKTIHEWRIAEKRLIELNVPYVSIFTDHKHHAEELAYSAAASGFRRFLAVGGDGSVHETLTGMMRWCDDADAFPEEFTLGVIPIGSGNDWIKTYSVPHDTEKVVELVAGERTVHQDVVRVVTDGGERCYMANIGGVGFDSQVCVRVNAQKEAGHRSKRIYVNALVHTVLNLKKFRAEVLCDGNSIFRGTCFSLAFGNGRYSGGGMLQTAKAVPDDGLVDVLVVPQVSLFTILKEAHRVFDGTTNESRSLIYSRAREICVAPLDANSAEAVEVDGEIVGRLPMRIQITGHYINVISLV